jgi:hypothetical protein
MDEYPTGEPDGDSRLKISSWGTRIKTSGWLLFIVGLGRAWRELIWALNIVWKNLWNFKCFQANPLCYFIRARRAILERDM